jgi:hypothetical protein
VLHECLNDPVTVATLSGIGTGCVTLARRLAIPSQTVKRSPFWRRLQHSLAGFVWAGAAGFAIAMLLADVVAPTRLIGWTVLLAVCFDLTSSEGLAWLARTYLRVKKEDSTTTDDSRGTGS